MDAKKYADDNDRNLEHDLDCLADAFFSNLQRNDCEYGGIGLDDKRPFGNSQVSFDILEIIDHKSFADDGEEGAAHAYADTLYRLLIGHLQSRWSQYKKFYRSYAEAE